MTYCCCCVVPQVTVRAQEKSEEVSSGLPFLADLALALSVLGCTMLHLLYQGPATSQDEQRCAHLLKSRLLQRCVWQLDSTDVTAVATRAYCRHRLLVLFRSRVWRLYNSSLEK